MQDVTRPVLISGLPFECGESPKILVLGSFPSPLSLERQEYYAHPKNQFWKIMDVLFENPPESHYQERLESLKRDGIALWDILCTCERKGAMDRNIRNATPNDIRGFIEMHPAIRLIAANGRTAGLHFSRTYKEGFQGVSLLILPSTSPANARISLPEKIARWSILKRPP